MITTTVRMDVLLYEKIVKQSEKDDRSINQEIKWMIKSYLNMIEWNQKR